MTLCTAAIALAIAACAGRETEAPMTTTTPERKFAQTSFSFRPIPAGTWQLSGRKTAHSPRRVSVQPFWLASTPVTNADYERFDPAHRAQREAISNEDGAPVSNVTYHDALRYCAWLSAQLGVEVRLPTSLEWEWACLGGGDGPYAFGEIPSFTRQSKWANVGTGKAGPAGRYAPNGFGLYDMAGNVHEMCSDAWVVDEEEIRVLPGEPRYEELLPRAVRELVVIKNCSARMPDIATCACDWFGHVTRESKGGLLSFRVAVSAMP